MTILDELVSYCPERKWIHAKRGNSNKLVMVPLLSYQPVTWPPLTSIQSSLGNGEIITLHWLSGLSSFVFAFVWDCLCLTLCPVTQGLCMLHLPPRASQKGFHFVHLFLKQNHSRMHRTKGKLWVLHEDSSLCPHARLLLTPFLYKHSPLRPHYILYFYQ